MTRYLEKIQAKERDPLHHRVVRYDGRGFVSRCRLPAIFSATLPAFHSCNVLQCSMTHSPSSHTLHCFSQCRLRPAGGTSLRRLVWHTALLLRGPCRCRKVSPPHGLKQEPAQLRRYEKNWESTLLPAAERLSFRCSHRRAGLPCLLRE